MFTDQQCKVGVVGVVGVRLQQISQPRTWTTESMYTEPPWYNAESPITVTRVSTTDMAVDALMLPPEAAELPLITTSSTSMRDSPSDATTPPLATATFAVNDEL